MKAPHEELSMRSPKVARIQEPLCIGCTKCIQACPVDAIMGCEKHMHVIITHECIGCGLCVEPCPMDCIEMVSIESITPDPLLAKQRFKAKKQRHAVDLHAGVVPSKDEKQAYLLAALDRVRKKRG